ncbi:hypothetical protein N9L68_04430 [bacterium]|nr:hypothetical protein [bacterium]
MMSEADPLAVAGLTQAAVALTEAEDIADETDAEWEIESQAGGSRSKAALSWELAGLLRSACGLAVEIAESSGLDEKCVYLGMASQPEEWAATAAATAAADECRARDERIWRWANIYFLTSSQTSSKLFSGSAVKLRLDRPPECPQEDPAPQPPAPRACYRASRRREACLDLEEWAQGRSGRRVTVPAAVVRPGAGRRAERRESIWEHGWLIRMLSQVLWHDRVTHMRADGAALSTI